jgi:peptidoglycan/LPS O-acetylase OafA/YrhL
LITGILLDSLTASNFFRIFYIRRSLRIAPLHFAFLTVVFSVLLISRHARPEGSLWWYWLYAANWKPNHTHGDPFVSHLWSLAIEEQFYLMWALIQKLSPSLVAILAYVAAMFTLSYALAWLSFRFFETPINRLKRNFRYSLPVPHDSATRTRLPAGTT